MHRSVPVVVLALLALCVLLPVDAYSGTLCGTVRDAQTQTPVARAGVFVFDPSGGYTGFYAATDSTGSFCIESIPEGTYDLAIRVDHYLAAWITGVTTSGPTGIEVSMPAPALRLSPPYPNPARSSVRLEFEMVESRPVHLSIYSAAGTMVRRWSSSTAAPGARSLIWDGLDQSGRSVPAGVYFVQLTSGDQIVTRRLVLLP